ncbi:Hsp20/alpha crystallin family protein [Cognatilysobacter segetis]|uniref:Hsp20/alpha crystallin family protein n=1 Tax=Cognatilysobacter segetis TaxID=2492394 RepID=UPI00138FA2CA|nr:Hsp20/alpha crystallin family protein [Lysobacter segetis]
MANIALSSIQRPLRAFDDDFERMFNRLERRFERDVARFDMRSDVTEDDTRYVVDVDLPGVRKEDIDVAVSGNSVTVQAQFGDHSGGTGAKRLQKERTVGECFRSFTFPSEIDTAKATATFDHGVLTLSLPKADGARPHHLRVS